MPMVLDLPQEQITVQQDFLFTHPDTGKVTSTKVTHRQNTVLAHCDGGAWVGNTKAGVTDQHSVRLVRWRQESD